MMIFRFLGRSIIVYLVLAGIGAHLAVGAALLMQPERTRYVITRVKSIVRQQLPDFSQPLIPPTQEQLRNVVPPYVHVASGEVPAKTIWIGQRKYKSLSVAAKSLQDGELMRIGPGTYKQSMIVRANNVRIVGEGKVVIEKTLADGKGAMLVKGDWAQIRNIECRLITASDNNGACVRLEGMHLQLEHVYFHDSQQGLLAGRKHGVITINNSRFENLGKNGQAHGIYVGGEELDIRNSVFLSAKSQGHEIKSRMARTRITASIVASLEGKDSRLIDISNGGELIILDSILAQGRGSANQDAIGYGLEGMTHALNRIEIIGNLILLERPAGNTLLHRKSEEVETIVANNIIVAEDDDTWSDSNTVFEDREDAGILAYPYIPPIVKAAKAK